MSSEIVYTSAPQGLKQGSIGFCTVLATRGIPVNLISRMEMLSGYRHLYQPQDASAAQNPVAWSHTKVAVSGQAVSVLSRVSAYGSDYSGRTNKLAHHIALSGAELSPAGPAWLLQQPALMKTAWDGQVRTPDAGPAIPQANQAAVICRSWDRLTGDAGWGGVVAEAAIKPGGKPIWVIYKLQHQNQLLGLVNELLSLMSPADRWNATFSTYFTTLPPEVDCRLRFVVEGTKEAAEVARTSPIILGTNLGPAPASRWAEAARTGQSLGPSQAAESVVTTHATGAVRPQIGHKSIASSPNAATKNPPPVAPSVSIGFPLAQSNLPPDIPKIQSNHQFARTWYIGAALAFTVIFIISGAAISMYRDQLVVQLDNSQPDTDSGKQKEELSRQQKSDSIGDNPTTETAVDSNRTKQIDKGSNESKDDNKANRQDAADTREGTGNATHAQVQSIIQVAEENRGTPDQEKSRADQKNDPIEAAATNEGTQTQADDGMESGQEKDIVSIQGEGDESSNKSLDPSVNDKQAEKNDNEMPSTELTADAKIVRLKLVAGWIAIRFIATKDFSVEPKKLAYAPSWKPDNFSRSFEGIEIESRPKSVLLFSSPELASSTAVKFDFCKDGDICFVRAPGKPLQGSIAIRAIGESGDATASKLLGGAKIIEEAFGSIKAAHGKYVSAYKKDNEFKQLVNPLISDEAVAHKPSESLNRIIEFITGCESRQSVLQNLRKENKWNDQLAIEEATIKDRLIFLRASKLAFTEIVDSMDELSQSPEMELGSLTALIETEDKMSALAPKFVPGQKLVLKLKIALE